MRNEAPSSRLGDWPPEAALVRRARGGDLGAFAALVRRYEGLVWRFLAPWVPEPSDREDVVQEVFLAAYRGIRRFRGEARWSTWLLQIAVNQARAHRRRAARQPRHVELADAHAGGAAAVRGSLTVRLGERHSPEQVATWRELRVHVWRLVDQLPETWQVVIRLRYVEGMSQREIAEVLGVPLGTVKARLHRARRRLAACLQREGLP